MSKQVISKTQNKQLFEFRIVQDLGSSICRIKTNKVTDLIHQIWSLLSEKGYLCAITVKRN